METPKIFESEYRFCLILWENEPVKSSRLVELCKEQLGWKPTTTYTVIKRLSERGVLKNENTVVTSLVSKEEVQAAEIHEMVEKTFEGSLPAFVAAFTKHQKLSEKEIDAVQQMKDMQREITKAASIDVLQAQIDLADHIQTIARSKTHFEDTKIKDIRKTRKREQQRTHRNYIDEVKTDEN